MALSAFLGAAGFELGRVSAPAPAKTTEVSHSAVAAAKAATVQKTETALSSVAVDQGVRWRERIVYRPGGTTTVIRTVEKRDETKATEAKAETASATTIETRTVEVEKLKVVETARPNWSVAARAGLGLDGKPRYQGEAGRRIVGGLWLTLGADVATRAALVGLRMDF